MKAIWAGEWHSAWFTRACQKKVVAALKALSLQEVRRARKFEIQHLEDPALSPAAIVAADGNSRRRPKQTLPRSRAAIERVKDRVDRKSAETSGGRGQCAIQTDELIAERAARRQAVVSPILTKKRWKPGRLAAEAGIGKNSVYEYLDGTRREITTDNRKAIALARAILAPCA